MSGTGGGAACEILIIGSELTAGVAVDTNSAWLRGQLRELDVAVRRIHLLPDDEEVIAAVAAEALDRAPLVLATGGLGPTEDDRTLAALARATGRPLVRSGEVQGWLEALARQVGRRLTPALLRQADLPEGSRPLANRRGSAPGVWVEQGSSLLVALPGVPGEMRGLYREHLAPALRGRFGAARRHLALLRVGGRWEAQVDETVADACAAAGVDRTILAGSGTVALHLSGPRPAVEGAVEEIRGLLGQDLISAAGETLEEVVLREARARGGTLAVAESCTGGRIAARLTSVPGASAAFREGVVAYADDAKLTRLHVPEEVLARHGAVSEETARAMVQGLMTGGGATWGLAVTGIAGPEGGSPDKPVGTVWMACRGPAGEQARHLVLGGGRERVQETAAGAGLDLLRRAILGGGPP